MKAEVVSQFDGQIKVFGRREQKDALIIIISYTTGAFRSGSIPD
jgi:hypothetical protein